MNIIAHYFIRYLSHFTKTYKNKDEMLLIRRNTHWSLIINVFIIRYIYVIYYINRRNMYVSSIEYIKTSKRN